jgi:importin subunit alpha-1
MKKNLFYRLEQANRVREVEARQERLEAAASSIAHLSPTDQPSDALEPAMEPQPAPLTDESPVISFDSAMENLQSLVNAIFQGSEEEKYAATMMVRKALSVENSPPIDDVIRAGLLPKLVDFLKRGSMPKLQFEAAWALTNVASGNSDQTQAVVDAGAMPIFVELLASPNDDVREQSAWAIANVAGDSPKTRDLMISLHCLKPLAEIALKKCEKTSILRNVAYALSNLCRGKPPPDFEAVSLAMPALAHLLGHTDADVLKDTCWCFSYLSDGSNDKIAKVLESGVCPRLVELLSHPSSAVVAPALRAVGNIATGEESQTQAIIDCGVLEKLAVLMESSKTKEKKEAVWTLSNITAGTTAQIQTVLDAGLFPAVIKLLASGKSDIRKEAAWVIGNATEGNAEQVQKMVEMGVIQPLCDRLNDTEAIREVVLTSLENIVKLGDQIKSDGSMNPFAQQFVSGGGLEMIKSLQDSNEKARRMLVLFPAQDQEQKVTPASDHFTSEVAELLLSPASATTAKPED